MSGKLAWGIIGTGAIAKTFAGALVTSKTGQLVAVGSRTQESADAFGEKFSVAKRYGSYEELLADSEVQAVYISTPHPMHAEWAVKAAEAGKHILCEKPLTLNFPQAMAVVEAARRSDVFLMEAFMYRCHPQTAKLLEIIKQGLIGEVRVIQATFSFNAGYNLESRLLKNELGGGGIMDVGCYCTSMSRLIAGAAAGMDFAEPIEVKGSGRVGETGVDEWAAGILKFPGDIVAQISCGVRITQENVLRVFGTEGSIMVPSPWTCARGQGTPKIVLARNGQPEEEILIETDQDLFAIEADTVAACIENRQATPPAMTWADTLGNMRTLDRWRTAVGVVFDIEQPTANFPAVDGKPLKQRRINNMKYGEIPGVGKPVSRMVMGGTVEDMQFPLPHTSMLFDEFFASGGNCFDTAHIYGNSELWLGKWIKNRDIREQVIILDKGAHTPWCTPELLSKQLFESLDKLQTDYVDLYLMHRDNLEVPVGEFVDVLNVHKVAGRMRAFGGSNWTLDRVEAANAYAKSKGLTGFSAVSNNLSLARCIDQVWGGCISASDAESCAWFTKTQMPLMAWSSTARGFFVKAKAEDLSDPEMTRCWYSEDNFRRLERAKQLAAEKGVAPVTIAMAYALSQPFPVFALFGPKTIEEMVISLKALDVELTSDELRWLNLEI